MNIIDLIIILIFIIIYQKSNHLQKYNKVISIILFTISFIFIKKKYFFLLLCGLSIIIYNKKYYKETFNNYYDDYEDFIRYKPKDNINENYFYDYQNIGERLIKKKYYNYNYYPKIEKNINYNKNLIINNRIKGDNYTHKSNNIIRDNKYFLNNLNEQIKGYGKQNVLNEQLYNSKNNIFQFKNNTHNDQQNSNEWWERYFQLEEEKNNIQNKLDDNSRQIINLETDQQNIINDIKQNKLKTLRNKIHDNMENIDSKQECNIYGIDKITHKYLYPEKQNKYYGEKKANNDYIGIQNPFGDILNAYKKKPQLTYRLIKKIMEEDKNSCDNMIETKPIYIPPLENYNKKVIDDTQVNIKRCSKIKCPKIKCPQINP